MNTTHVLVRHKVADSAKWKSFYDSHLPARQQAGLTELHLLRSVNNPNEVVLLFGASDPQKAKAFAESADLREAMRQGGVTEKPEIFFLH